MQATAYCDSGETASGTEARRGIVAADPAVFPQGSSIRIDSTLRGYSGVYRVEDTGAAVKGGIIDIYVPDCAAARRFGRRTVSVRLLRSGPEEVVAKKD